MNNDTRWLARLGIDSGLFTRPQALLVRHTLGDAGDLMAFAQGLIDVAKQADVAALHKNVDEVFEVGGTIYSVCSA